MKTINLHSVPFTKVAPLLAALLLTACGGGGGSDTPVAQTDTTTTAQPGQQTTASASTIVSTNPATSAVNVAANAPLVATFSSTMNAASLASPATVFTVKETAGGAAVAGKVTVDATGKMAIFTPTAPLKAGTSYTATISAAAKNTAGVAIAKDYTWAFTTAAAAGVPSVGYNFPNAASGPVALNSKLLASFSTAMKPATLTDAFTVKDAAGTAVPGAVSYDTATNTAIFTPTATLAANTTYTAAIAKTATDANGNALATAYSWTFVSSAANDTTNPTVDFTNTTPAHDPTGLTPVPLATKVNVAFSEIMDPSTFLAADIMNADGTIARKASFILIDKLADTRVPGTLVVNVQNKTAIFTPTSPLKASTHYLVNLTADLKDLAALNLKDGTSATAANGSSFEFVTGTQ